MRPAVAALTFLLALLATGPSTGHAPAADKKAIAASIASPDRPAEDREQDVWRKPETVLELLGARPGMKVIDYFAADGYYTELLARIVGPKGQVISYNNNGYASYAGKGIAKRFANRRVPNTLLKVAEISDLKLPPASLDAALFVMSYHDVYYTPENTSKRMGDPDQMVSALYAALKPGGVVVVEDHVAASGSDPVESVQKLHRIDPAAVKRTFEQAGFRLDGESDALKNAEDDHTKLVFDPAIRHKTDQFIYRFTKPH